MRFTVLRAGTGDVQSGARGYEPRHLPFLYAFGGAWVRR